MKTDNLGGGWSKFTVLEPETQTFYNRYYYKRILAHRVVIDTPKAKALAAYTLIEKDLRSVLVWLYEIRGLLADDKVIAGKKGSQKTAHDRTRYNLIKGLFVASLTFYAKCFTSCEGRRIKLEKKNLSDDFQKDHDSIMEMRHNFAAHSGAKQVEKVHVVLALDSKKRKGAVPFITRELGQPDSYNLDSTLEFIALALHVKEFVDLKVDTLNEKLLKDDILTKPPEYWYKKT
ncbi:hypothetical protein [Rheinheimera sp. EpRS3]|uniref:hypothetical protein n=1 Tax=Rheinheimera sp. EpRS3 TaxID=1712383 RepID=UPI00074A56CC|nr:hypothetical protein [Rheinheimera sp. EpRS3]KUM53700.1 hypothetical protein AR688_18720 [Rheinheimera sp. EpRS3]